LNEAIGHCERNINKLTILSSLNQENIQNTYTFAISHKLIKKINHEEYEKEPLDFTTV